MKYVKIYLQYDIVCEMYQSVDVNLDKFVSLLVKDHSPEYQIVLSESVFWKKWPLYVHYHHHNQHNPR